MYGCMVIKCSKIDFKTNFNCACWPDQPVALLVYVILRSWTTKALGHKVIANPHLFHLLLYCSNGIFKIKYMCLYEPLYHSPPDCTYDVYSSAPIFEI